MISPYLAEMLSIQSCPIADRSLLHSYVNGSNFADSYTTTIGCVVSHEQFVTAFYTTWLFKLERWILAWTVSKPSTDLEASQLAAGARDSFAAWYVEARARDQLLMCDLFGNTRSWFMVTDESESKTRLYFGSAVVARKNPRTGEQSLGPVFRALLGFHRLYSRALLRAARSRLESQMLR